MKKEKIVEYDILRVIVTLLVVVGHCTYHCITTPYGGADYTSFVPQTGMSKIYTLAVAIVAQIYMFHMPLYMALSGALFDRSLHAGGGVYTLPRSVE